MAVDKISKTINLDLSKVPRSRRSDVKEQVGEFIVTEILRKVEEGRSPVSGRGSFKKLSKQYASEEKGGDRTANLELDGDMLDALTSKNRKGDTIEVGIFKSSQVPKADGHNNFSGDSKLPTRRFIPKGDESFKRDIMTGVKRIIELNESLTPQDLDIETVEPSTSQTASQTTSINISNLFSATGGESIIRRLLGEGES